MAYFSAGANCFTSSRIEAIPSEVVNAGTSSYVFNSWRRLVPLSWYTSKSSACFAVGMKNTNSRSSCRCPSATMLSMSAMFCLKYSVSGCEGPDQGRYMSTVRRATAGLCTISTPVSAAPDDRRSDTRPSVLRRVSGFSLVAVTVSVVSPRVPSAGDMSKPPPVVESIHGPVAVTVKVASEPAILRSTISSALLSSTGCSASSLLHPASRGRASSSQSARRIICRYGVSGC